MRRFFLWGLILSIVPGIHVAQDTDKAILDHLAKSEKFQYEIIDSAIYYASAAAELSLSNEKNNLLARSYNRQGAVYYVSGDYGKAMEKFTQALEMCEELDDKTGKVFALNGLGLIYLTEEEFDQAIILWKQCLEINRGLKDSISIAKNLFNLGIGFSELDNLDESLRSYEAALKALKGHEEHVLNVMIDNRIGRHYYDIGDFEQSIGYYSEVLANVDNITNWEKAYAYTGLGEVYFSLNDLQKAEENGRKGYNAALQIGAYWDLERATSLLSKIYVENGDLANALMFTKENKAHSDSLYATTKNRQISRMQLKISNANNKNLIAENEASRQKVKLQNVGLAVSLSGMLVLGILVFVYKKNIKLKERFNEELKAKNEAIEFQKKQIDRQNESLLAINQTKDKLFSIISHDLRSPIHSILQTLEMHHMGYFDDIQQSEALDLLYKQVSQTDRMLNDLLQWANEQTENIQPKFTNLEPCQVINDLIAVYEFQARTKEIQVHHHQQQISPLWVDTNQFRIIFQNLIHNAIKFTPNFGDIFISYTENEHEVNIHVRDSGEGMDEHSFQSFSGKRGIRMYSQVGTAEEKGSGLGLILVRQFVVQNKGSIQLRTSPGFGTEFILSFNKAASA